MNILVTAVNGDLGQGILKALKLSNLKLNLFGCDVSTMGAGTAFVQSCELVPFAKDSKEYLESIKKLCKRMNISAVIPASQPEIELLSMQKIFPLLSNSTVIVSLAYDWIKEFGDKLSCMNHLKGKIDLANYADGTDSEAVNELIFKSSYPIVVKPRFSSGSEGVYISNNKKELDFAIEKVQSPIVQQYIDDECGEYSIGLFRCNNLERAIAFKRELGPRGCSWFAETSNDKSVIEYAIKIGQISGLIGSANIQIRKNKNNKPKLLEINPRFSSLVAARAFSGFADVEWSLKLSLGLELIALNEDYKNIRFIRYIHELISFNDVDFAGIEKWLPKST